MTNASRLVALALIATTASGPAWAYIGPGAGLSLIAAFWALLVAVLSSLAFVVLWPLRKHLRRRKDARARREDGYVAPRE